MTLAAQYAELLSMAQLYLLQEHAKEEWLFTDRQNFVYFKETAQKQQPPRKQEKVSPPQSKPQSTYTPPPAITPTPKPLVEALEPKPIPQPKIEEKKAPTTYIPTHFTLEKLPASAPVDLNDMRQIVAEKFPQVAILDEIPQPVVPNGVADVILINISQDVSHQDFLEKVAKAIKDRFCSAQVIGQQTNWDPIISSPNLKLVLMVGSDFDKVPELQQYYREMPKLNRQLLGKVPFIPMAEISAYLTDTKQKSFLWKSVCEHLQA